MDININLNKNKPDDNNYIKGKKRFNTEEKNFNPEKNVDTFINLKLNTYKSLKKDFLKLLVKK